MPKEEGSSEAAPSSSGRKLLVAVDDSAECERALAWALGELYRPNDQLHLVHVLPKMQLAAMYGAPPVDFLPQQDPVAYEQLLKNAEHFITDRFLPKLSQLRPDPIVHIVKGEVDTDSIGNVICRKADEVDAAAVVMASHTRSKLTEFVLGSVTNYCTHHCKVDEAEDKDGGLGPAQAPEKLAPVPAALGGEEAFPSLGEAVTKKISKRDRKAKQTVSLKDFQSGAYKAPRPSAKPASDADILASLPSGPRVRDDDDVRPSMGGAFHEYGGDRGRGDREGDRERGGRFGGRSGFGGSQDGSQDGYDADAPARADVSDDWGKDRKFVSSGGPDSDRGRSGGREDREPLGPSRADESRSWGADRKPYEPSGGGGGAGGGTGRYDDRDRDADRDRDRDMGPSRADTEDRWAKKFTPSDPAPPSRGGGGGGGGLEDRWGGPRRGGGFDDGDRGPRSGSPVGGAPPGGRPRLNLAKRTLPPPEVKVDERAAALPPRSTASSESAEAGPPAGAELGPPKPRANPFGAARPREEVLKEQGRDATREELQRRALDRLESNEEQALRESIQALRVRLDAGEGGAPAAAAARPAPEAGAAALTMARQIFCSLVPSGDFSCLLSDEARDGGGS
ncbi:hypothetical protein WJX81_008304 [Elliptochloris bilobata]|uniref:UspA domain-containing protein n=1 Tax=Elliptochloris bilobata TaxID=381761 RepID=A0AAW1R2N2_9CHLO